MTVVTDEICRCQLICNNCSFFRWRAGCLQNLPTDIKELFTGKRAFDCFLLI